MQPYKKEYYAYNKYIYHENVPQHAPERCAAFRVVEENNIFVITLLVYENAQFNNIPTIDVIDTMTILHYCRKSHIPVPRSFAPHPLTPQTLAYGQSSIATLSQLFTPLIQNFAQKLYPADPIATPTQISRYFTYDDVVQEGYVALASLASRGYYITRRLLAREMYNRVIATLRKMPTHYIVNSLDDPTSLTDATDDVSLTYADSIPVEDENINHLIEDPTGKLLRERKIVIDYLGERQYMELIRAYASHTTSNATNNKIQTIKRYIRKHNKNN